jgi:hypothetical protein
MSTTQAASAKVICIDDKHFVRLELLGYIQPVGKAIMTLGEIQQAYPDQWVIIEFTELDDELKVVEGRVIAHSPERDKIEETLAGLRNEKLAVEYTGGDTGEAYLL